MIISKKQLIREMQGVPSNIEPMVKIFTDFYLKEVKKIVDHIHEYHLEDRDYGNKTTHPITINVDYEDYEKYLGNDYYGNPDYKRFPISVNGIKTKVKLSFYDNETIQELIKGEGGFGASVITNNFTNHYTNELFGIEMLVNVYLPITLLEDDDNFDTTLSNWVKVNLTTTIAHELTHVYQVYKQYDNTGRKSYGKESGLNIMNNIFRSYSGVPKLIRDFMNLVYLHLSFENNARVVQFYHILKTNENLITKEDFIDYVKKHKYLFVEPMKLIKFDAESFYKSLKSDVVKILIELWENNLDEINDIFKYEYGENVRMEQLPSKVYKDPLTFFKFFENRFKKSGEDYRRKILRVVNKVYMERMELKESVLKENEELVNKILDKINQQGMDSLSNTEKQYLDKISKGDDSSEEEEIINTFDNNSFSKTLSNGESLTFLFGEDDEVEDYGDEIILKGTMIHEKEEFYCDIYLNGRGEYQTFTTYDFDGEDIHFTEEITDEIELFLNDISEKIYKGL